MNLPGGQCLWDHKSQNKHFTKIKYLVVASNFINVILNVILKVCQCKFMLSDQLQEIQNIYADF